MYNAIIYLYEDDVIYMMINGANEMPLIVWVFEDSFYGVNFSYQQLQTTMAQ